MPQTPNVEEHFTGSETVRDLVIGMSDGLTVPSVLAAGLPHAIGTTRIIVTTGLAEIGAGSIAMDSAVTWLPGAMRNTMPARGSEKKRK